jgi:hypothetical protein
MVGDKGRVRSYRERAREKVRPYDPDDLADVVSFRHGIFGPDASIARAEYVRWMYDHPQGDDRPTLWIFRSAGGIEALQGVIRTSLLVDGRPVDTLWAAELFVQPAYQLRGVGAVLSEIAAEQAPLLTAFEVTDAAKKGFLRTGWTDLGDVALFTRPFDIAELGRARGRATRPAVAGAANLALRAHGAMTAAITRGLRIRLTEVDRFDERSDELWANVAPQYPVIAQRDASALNWRFADYPTPGRYRCYYVERGGQTIGHAVLRIGPYSGIDAGWIVDFLCAPRWAGPLLAACTRRLKVDGAQAVYCIHQPGRLGLAFTLNGFLRRSTGWPLMVHAGGVPEDVRATLTRPGNWFITAADSNVDRPRDDIVYAI